LKTMVGSWPHSDGSLGSQPTLSRFKNNRQAKDLSRLSEVLLELYILTHLRLLLHTLAYVLFLMLRRHLEDTELERAQVDTIRLKLLKIGARVRQTARKVWFHLAYGYPYKSLFTLAWERIRAAPW